MIDQIRGKEHLVVGMARSGISAVKILADGGAAKITVTDSKSSAELQEEIAALKRYAVVEVVTGANPPELIHGSLALIIKSPGVPSGLPLFRKAETLKIPVISEIELAYNFIRAPLVGITGTNGKTTTTFLVEAMLKEARFAPVAAAGNIGNPLSAVVNEVGAQGIVAAELSSFQLENIKSFRPFVAVFLNFSEDHTDYHGSVEKYFRAKARIFENQGSSDYAVLNAADSAVASLEKELNASILWFGLKPVKNGIGLLGEQIMLFKDNAAVRLICKRSEVALPGEHNLENALAASTAAWAAGADLTSVGAVLQNFKAIEHRLEQFAVIEDVAYINDSKGTNPEATIKALQSFPGRRIILIAGGKDKGSEFSALAKVIKCKAGSLILVGETKAKLASAVETAGFTSYRTVETFEEAVIAARAAAGPGDLILLSPACASWDMFPDYEARGRLFKKLVLNGSA